jgi:putative DNA primase/helicase
MQAAGRGRAVNRTAETPLDVDILADVALPLRLTEAVAWEPVSPLLLMLITEGIVLLSARDLVQALGWKLRSAQRAVHEFKNRQNLLKNTTEGFGGSCRKFRYRHKGERWWRQGYYLPAVLSDPTQWLKEKIGPMQHVEVGGMAA